MVSLAISTIFRVLMSFIGVALIFTGILTLPIVGQEQYPNNYTVNEAKLSSLWFSFDWGSDIDLRIVNKTSIVINDMPIVEYKLLYKLKPGDNVYVFGVLLQRPDLATPAPAILLIHGIGGSHEQVLELAQHLAMRGYTVLAIDAPGHGVSGIIGSRDWREAVLKLDPIEENLLYQVYLAGLRGVELLLQWNNTDAANIAVIGVSMGGMASIVVGCLHPNVKAIVPLISSGCIYCMVKAGGIANIMAPSDVSLDSPLAQNLAYIDPLTYAQRCGGSKYFYFMFSTHDPYFPLSGLKLTIKALRERGAQVYTYIKPNAGHNISLEEVKMLVPVFLDEIAFPSKKLKLEAYTSLYYVPFALGYRLADLIVWRPSVKGLAFLTTETNVIVYGSPIDAYAIYKIGALKLTTLPERYGSNIESIVSTIFGILLLILIVYGRGLIPMLPYIALIVVSLLILALPYYIVWPGRFSISLLDAIETFSSLTNNVLLISALVTIPHAFILYIGLATRRKWVLSAATLYAILTLIPFILVRLIIIAINARAQAEIGTSYAATIYPIELAVAGIALAALVYKFRVEPYIRRKRGEAAIEEWSAMQ